MHALIIALLLVVSYQAHAKSLDLSLQDTAALYSATTAGYKGSRSQLILVGKEREALYLAKGMAVECYEDDLDCALSAVAVSVMTRVALSSSPGVSITPSEVLYTPSQYTGMWSSPLLRDEEELRTRVKKFLPIARYVISGGLNGSHRPSTHYALEASLLSSVWGKALIKEGFSFYKLPDGHLVLDGLAKFRRPKRARNT